jgi:hypothetical protein
MIVIGVNNNGQSNKHFSLVRKLENYGQKTLITFGPGRHKGKYMKR